MNKNRKKHWCVGPICKKHGIHIRQTDILAIHTKKKVKKKKIPENFLSPQIFFLALNCLKQKVALKKSDRNFFPKWPTAAILDFRKCRKTIAHNAIVHAMFPENLKAIGQGVQELSFGNAELLQYTTKCQFSKKMASGGHVGFQKMPKNDSAQWQSTCDISWKFQGNRSRRSRVIVRKPKRRKKKKQTKTYRHPIFNRDA